MQQDQPGAQAGRLDRGHQMRADPPPRFNQSTQGALGVRRAGVDQDTVLVVGERVDGRQSDRRKEDRCGAPVARDDDLFIPGLEAGDQFC